MFLRLVLALLAGSGCAAVMSAEPETPDAELLEFLGSWEGEDDEWQEFFDGLPVIADEEPSVDRSETGESE